MKQRNNKGKDTQSDSRSKKSTEEKTDNSSQDVLKNFEGGVTNNSVDIHGLIEVIVNFIIYDFLYDKDPENRKKLREDISRQIAEQIKELSKKDKGEFSDVFTSENIKQLVEKVLKDVFSSKLTDDSLKRSVTEAFKRRLEAEDISETIKGSLTGLLNLDGKEINNTIKDVFEKVISSGVLNSENFNYETVISIVETGIKDKIDKIDALKPEVISQNTISTIVAEFVKQTLEGIKHNGINPDIFSKDFFEKALTDAFTNAISTKGVLEENEIDKTFVKEALQNAFKERIGLPDDISDTIVNEVSKLIIEKVLKTGDENINPITKDKVESEIVKIISEKFIVPDAKRNDPITKDKVESEIVKIISEKFIVPDDKKNDPITKKEVEDEIVKIISDIFSPIKDLDLSAKTQDIIKDQIKEALPKLGNLNIVEFSENTIQDIIKNFVGVRFEDYEIDPVKFSERVISDMIEQKVSGTIRNITKLNPEKISEDTIKLTITSAFKKMLDPIDGFDVKDETTKLIEKIIDEKFEPLRKQLEDGVNLLISEENNRIRIDLNNKRETLETAIKDYSEKQDELIRKLDAVAVKDELVKNELDTLSRTKLTISETQKDIELKYKDIEKEQSSIDREKKSIESQKADIEKEKSTISETLKDIELKYKDIEEKQFSIDREKEGIESQKAEIEKTKNDVISQRNSISEITNSYKKLLTQRMLSINDKMGVLKDKSKALYGENSNLYTFVSKANDFYIKFKDSVEELLKEDNANYSLLTYQKLKDSAGLYGWASYIMRISSYSRLDSFKFYSESIISVIKDLEILTILLYTEHGIELLVPSLLLGKIEDNQYTRKTDATLWSEKFCETIGAIKDIIELGYKSYLDNNDDKKPVIYY